MAVYNGEDYVEEAVGSILDQTFSDFEFIIVNDGSRDGSRRILEDLAYADHRIRLIHQENKGLTRSLIGAIDLSRGQYIARMDADDLSMPTRLERQVALLDAQPAIGIASTSIEFMNADGAKRFVRDASRYVPAALAFFLCFSNPLAGHGQVMFRKAAYDAVGGYNPDFRYAQDYDLWERMLRQVQLGHIDEVLYRYRTSGNSISTKNRAGQQQCRLRVSARAFEHLTGHTLSGSLLEIVNEFWFGRGSVEIKAADYSAITRVLFHAYDAWCNTCPDKAIRRQVRRVVARTYLMHSLRDPARNTTKQLNCLIRALRWDVGLLGEISAILLRRLRFRT